MGQVKITLSMAFVKYCWELSHIICVRVRKDESVLWISSQSTKICESDDWDCERSGRIGAGAKDILKDYVTKVESIAHDAFSYLSNFAVKYGIQLSTWASDSVEHSGGQRVRLDLQKLSQFSIFPGQVKISESPDHVSSSFLKLVSWYQAIAFLLQVVGVEGHNPSGHCLIASKVIDYVPMSVPSDEYLHPTKKHAVDQEFQFSDPSMLGELSMVCKLGFCIIR